MEKPLALIPVLLILIFLKFGIGAFLFYSLKKKMRRADDVLFVLFGTMKNGGAATAIALFLFCPASTISLAVAAIVTPFYIVYLEDYLAKKEW